MWKDTDLTLIPLSCSFCREKKKKKGVRERRRSEREERGDGRKLESRK